jgi:alpha-galactosidase
VLSAQTVLTNTGETPLDVARLVSGTFLLPDTMTTFGIMHGAWGMEWGQSPTELRNGALVIESRRNRSHDHFPGLVAGATGTTQNTGEAYGAQLGWSGGHRFCVERMEDARYRLSVSEYLYPGEGSLPPGAALKTPVAYAAFSPQGYAGIARAFQAFARTHVLQWPGGAMKPRPVLLNSWEGNLFDLHEDSLRRQIDATADLGVERFVLDDGWFGSRRNDRQGLGDWTVARSIFPQGLRPLSDHVHARGMQFGLWYEPEMANPDSDVFRAHPDWALQVRGRPLLTSRRQVALDISRPEVADHLFTTLSHEVTNSRIDYIKWDFNRDLLDAADAQGRAAYRRQVLALYALWDRLHHAHPELEIESCASGGGRPDWGALRHTQRVWTSDNTSAIDRVGMQGRAWHFLPPEVTGTHVSAVPNGIDGRTTTLDYRAAVAIFGHLGIELNPLKLTDAERMRLRGWIALHKRLRGVLHHGEAQFADDGPDRIVRGVTSTDRRTGIYLLAQENRPPVRRSAPVRLCGLDTASRYRVTIPKPQTAPGGRLSPAQMRLYADGLVLSGAALMDMGLFLPDHAPQTACVIECQAVRNA